MRPVKFRVFIFQYFPLRQNQGDNFFLNPRGVQPSNGLRVSWQPFSSPQPPTPQWRMGNGGKKLSAHCLAGLPQDEVTPDHPALPKMGWRRGADALLLNSREWPFLDPKNFVRSLAPWKKLGKNLWWFTLVHYNLECLLGNSQRGFCKNNCG